MTQQGLSQQKGAGELKDDNGLDAWDWAKNRNWTEILMEAVKMAAGVEITGFLFHTSEQLPQRLDALSERDSFSPILRLRRHDR
jgi:hypothetical protein